MAQPCVASRAARRRERARRVAVRHAQRQSLELLQLLHGVGAQIEEEVQIVDIHAAHEKEEFVHGPKAVQQERLIQQSVEVPLAAKEINPQECIIQQTVEQVVEVPPMTQEEVVHVPKAVNHHRHHHVEVEQIVDTHVPHEKEDIMHVPKIVQQEHIIQRSMEQEEEEAEEELYSQRSKLFCFRDGEWKDRGLGEAKLLQHHETRRVRFMFRHEKTGKTVSNHYPLDAPPHCVLQPNAGSDKAWVWSTPDDAEEEVEVERFALKFGYPELAKAFKVAFDEAKVLNDAKVLNEKTGDAPQAHGRKHQRDANTQTDDLLSECKGDPEDLRQEVMDSRREIKRLRWEAVKLKYAVQPEKPKDPKQFKVLELPLDVWRLAVSTECCFQNPVIEDWRHEIVWKLRPEPREGTQGHRR